MKRLVTTVFLVFFMLFLASGARAYTITFTDPAGDQIGQTGFDSFSIICNVGTDPVNIAIATNYPKNGILVGDWQTLPADLLLDGSSNGTGWDFAIPLVSHDGFTAGQMYSIGSMYVSDDFEPSGGGYTYNHDVPVWLKTGSAVGLGGSWNWMTFIGNPNYLVTSIGTNWIWNDEGGTDLLRIGWATSTCANDLVGMTTPVPEPSTLLLFGAGLVFATPVLYRRMRKGECM